MDWIMVIYMILVGGKAIHRGAIALAIRRFQPKRQREGDCQWIALYISRHLYSDTEAPASPERKIPNKLAALV